MLNQWEGSEKPTRSDFARDNLLIDTAIWQHTADPYQHLSDSEKQRVSDPYTVTVVQGTDTAQRVISIGFTPKLVLYFSVGKPIAEVDNGVSIVRACIAVPGYGSSGGCAIGSAGLTVEHMQTSTFSYDLNSSDEQYIMIAFR